MILNRQFASTEKGKSNIPQSSGSNIPDVPGVSDRVVKVPNQRKLYIGL